MINGLPTIGIFLVVQLIAAIWWAATISTKMSFVLTEVKGIRDIEKKMYETLTLYSTRSEVAIALAASEKELATALAFANKELAAMWKQIDMIKAKQ